MNVLLTTLGVVLKTCVVVLTLIALLVGGAYYAKVQTENAWDRFVADVQEEVRKQ